jgi:hypothetical protein
MSEVRPQLLITLVHGTWPRGFFRTFFPRLVRFKQRVRELTRRQRRDPPPFWFEEGSPFLAHLGTELGDISYKIKPLRWTGENSIVKRDGAAHVLAEHLSAEHAEHPQATQLVIAHSHGGNIALRALHHLHQRDPFRSSGAERANPLVVTLATPFVEVHHADLGLRPTFVRLAVFLPIIVMLLGRLAPEQLWPWARAIFPFDRFFLIPAFISLAAFLLLYHFILRDLLPAKSQRRQNQVEALRDATRLGEIVSAQAQRLLIIRAIDDEASLVLALGTIGTYVTTRAIKYALLISLLPTPVALILFYFLHRRYEAVTVQSYEDAVAVVSLACIFILLGLLLIARSVHGRELAGSSMECQINTHSTPDAIGLSKIVTLVRHTFVKSLRHGIYNYEDCAKVISDWVHSQVCTVPAR